MDYLFAGFNYLFDAHFANILRLTACQPELLFRLQLYRQSLCVPASAKYYFLFSQYVVSVPKILDNTTAKMACVWFAVHCRRPLYKADELLTVPTTVDASHVAIPLFYYGQIILHDTLFHE